MVRPVSDEQLDRAIATLLLERRQQVVASMSARHFATRAPATHPAMLARQLALTTLAVLLLGIIAIAVAVVGSRPSRPSAPSDRGMFTPTGTMITTRFGHTATLLKDGRVLVLGGRGGDLGATFFASAEVWDPTTGTFTSTGSMTTPRSGHTATLLPDGRVLVVGGETCGDGTCDDHVSAELWDPVTGSFQPTGPLSTARGWHTASLLADGRVLIVGGQVCPLDPCQSRASVELWDPTSGSFSPAGPLHEARAGHGAVTLPDGRVMVVGGMGDAGYLASTEVWDPSTGTFAVEDPLRHERAGLAAVLLPDGTVLVVGGSCGRVCGVVATSERWEPDSGFDDAGDLLLPGHKVAASALPDGRVLVIVGEDPDAEIWDPASRTFVVGPHLSDARGSTTATALRDGRVLVTGGSADVSSGGPPVSAAVFDPEGG